MARKLVEIGFLKVLDPPTKNIWGGVQKMLVKNEKIKVVQNLLKWRENWSKLIFEIFRPPHQNLLGVYKKCWSEMKKSKLFEIGRYGEKIGQKKKKWSKMKN